MYTHIITKTYMQQNQSQKNLTQSVIPYLFILLLLIIGLTYYRIFIRHDYYIITPAKIPENSEK